MAPLGKKKVDYVALNSSFMRIPRMKIDVARDLLDLGFEEVYQLSGRSPEILFEELLKKRTNAPKDRLYYFRMAVYFSENETPDPKLLHPTCWQS